MKHIEKITISNARRFAENVEIDFGAGATIILATNGTGKTTIFEAIELALIGKVKRLENSPDAIIRKESSEMSARLNFSEGKYCQVDYAKGKECVPEGCRE
ncbi:MAG: AAA family ATPase [Candidatus Omnitrophota bacterium]